MCTLTWYQTNQTLTLTFNRDEQRSRSLAIAPALKIINGIKALSPTDPDGGGSWITVNQHGIIIALLNNYQPEPQPCDHPVQAINPHLAATPEHTHPALRKQTKTWISRGQLVHQLTGLTNIDAMLASIDQMNLQQYQPFHLLLISQQQQWLINWRQPQQQRDNTHKATIEPAPDFF